MTSRRFSNTTSTVRLGRRRGGPGEPAAHPVPPLDRPPFDDRPLLIDSRQVAHLLGIGRKTFQLMASGDLPTIRLGRCVRVPLNALQTWIAAQTSSEDA